MKLTPGSNDFVSVTDAGFMGPRQADGSLPALDFMTLRAGSQLIDKGTDVGLSFAGSAPDLGATNTASSPWPGAVSEALPAQATRAARVALEFPAPVAR